MARVKRGVPSANGELLFCELPDGTGGTLPAWMTNAAACAVLTVGPPVVAITALQELRVLLEAVVAGASDPTGASMLWHRGSWGGQRPSVADYVKLTRTKDGVIASGCRSIHEAGAEGPGGCGT